MPLSWNTVNTHTAGDVLPLADWNQAATALNSMVGTWITQGTIANTAINGTPPFFAYFGVINFTTNASGQYTQTIPNGGFPNGLIMAVGIPEISGTTNNQLTNVSSTSTKTAVIWVMTNTGTGAALATTAVTLNFMMIGY